MTRSRRATTSILGLLVIFSFVLGQAAYAAGPSLTMGKATTPAAAPVAQSTLDEGGVSLDFIAAGPNTYDHVTGVGGAFNDRTISKNNGVVESLEGGDFACGDRVVFFTAITVEPDAGSGSIELDYTYDGETTSGSKVGFDDLISASVNTGDSGNENLDGNESVTVNSESFITAGKDRLETSIQVGGVDAGDQIILRMVVELSCDPNPGNVTGNIHSTLDAARVVGGTTINSGQQTIPLKQTGNILLPGLNVEKTCPASATVGGTITYEITVSNTGQDMLNNLVVNDPLLGGNLAGFGASLAAGASVAKSFQHTLSANPDPVVNEVTATATGRSSNASVSDVADCTTDVLFPDLSIVKTADDNEIDAGDTAAFTLVVTNDGEATADDVTLVDTLPGGVSWSEDSHECEITGNVMTCDFDDLAPNDIRTVHVSGETDETDCGELLNVATVSASNDADDDASDNASEATVTVQCPDVTVLKEADASPVTPGDEVGFTITVSNIGEGDAYGVTLTDELPAGIDWSEDSKYCSIEDGVLTCEVKELDNGKRVSIHVTGLSSPEACGLMENTATVAADNETEEDADNNSSTATIVVDCPDIDIDKTADVEVVDAAELIGFTITVTNHGPGVAKDVTVTDTLPANAGLSWSIDGGTGAQMCGLDEGVLTCEFGDMQVEDPYTVHISSDTDASTCGLIDNTATATISNGEGDEDDAQIAVECPELGIDIVKGGPDLAHTGDTVTYTFTVSLATDEPLYDVVVTDPNCDAGWPAYVSGDDGDSVLQQGEVWTYTCEHVVTEDDPDPLPNVATVAGTADDGRTVTDEDDHLVDLIHPDILIIKSVTPRGGRPGDLVTYSYEIQNTGDTTLYDVSVDDDVIGHIGDIAVLESGETVTLTKEWELPADAIEVVNVGTATGTDVLGEEVSDDDDAVVTIVEALTPPTPPRPTAFTGSDALHLGTVAAFLLLAGLLALAIGRRRRDVTT